MRIESVTVYSVAMPIPQGRYTISGGRSYEAFDSTIVSLSTDTGLVGWGETSTLGANYLPAFRQGAIAAIGELAPHLLGEDPRHTDRINHRMDHAMHGHHYAKAALDMACWDILGKSVEMPLCDLLGGRFGKEMNLLTGITTASVEDMIASVGEYRAKGYRCFSLKLGGEPAADVGRLQAVLDRAAPGDEYYADCNGGWHRDQALRVMRQVRDLDIYFEQPCASYQECLAVRRQTDHPMILDEIVDGPETLLRIIADNAADLINLKISRLGGITRLRRMRDLCVMAGLPMTIQDTGGSGLTQAAIYHLAQSTPEEFRRSVYDPLVYAADPLTDAPVVSIAGQVEASLRPGLGQQPLVERLGAPVATYLR